MFLNKGDSDKCSREHGNTDPDRASKIYTWRDNEAYLWCQANNFAPLLFLVQAYLEILRKVYTET